MIEFNDYVKFYEENKDKIFMDEKETYPINRENMALWKNEVINAKRENCDILARRAIEREDNEDFIKYSIENEGCDTRDNTETYKLFAEIFENVIRHISFKEMIEKISKICEEISELVEKENFDNIYMYVSDPSSKSNTWVSLLFTHFLSGNTIFQEKAQVINNIDSVYDLYKEDTNKKILVLHIDDMSYSGTQMVQSVGNPGKLLKIKKENKNLHYYLGVAFIGSSAIERFKNEGYTNIKKFNNTEIIEKFNEQAKKYVENTYGQQAVASNDLRSIIGYICSGRPIESAKGGYGTSFPAFQCYDSIIPVYFDHKVADGVSTFQKILHFGSFPTTDRESCKNIPLIQGCENAIENAKGESAFLDGLHCFANVTDIDDEDTCPLTFYKRFCYTYNGEEVPKNDNIVSFINTVETISHRGGRKYTSRREKKYRKSKKMKYNKKSRNIKKKVSKRMKHKSKNIKFSRKKLRGGFPKSINGQEDTYQVLEVIQSDGRGGNIYKVKNSNDQELILKETKNQKEKEFMDKAGDVQIYDYFKKKNYYCIVMEYFPLSLKEYLKSGGNLSDDIQNDLLIKLDNLHSKGLLHNDATTSNWRRSLDNSNFVLIDYGDAEENDSITESDKKNELTMLYNSLKYSCHIKDKDMEIIAERMR